MTGYVTDETHPWPIFSNRVYFFFGSPTLTILPVESHNTVNVKLKSYIKTALRKNKVQINQVFLRINICEGHTVTQ